MRYQTKKQVEEVFRTDILPFFCSMYEQDGKPDYPARREAWGRFTDVLCREGRISLGQYERWTYPACCKGKEQ